METTHTTTAGIKGVDASQAGAAPPLGRHASSGFFWLLGQSGLLKIVGLAGQIALAWLLRKEDFGTYALALLVASTVGLIHQGGLSNVLISRGDRLARWITPAFWFSLSTGVLASLLMLALAPLAAWEFGNPGLRGLLYVLALSPVFNAVAVVPQAIMQAHMRFRAVALTAGMTGAGAMVLTVILAALGFRAYSFVIASVAASAATTVTLWWLSQPKVKFKLQLRRWRFLISDTGYAQGVSVMMLILGQADYFTLGRLQPAATVGLYYFAFTLSMQPVQFLAGSLGSVLLPVLSKLRSESSRQAQSFIRAARQLAILGIPACIIQAVLARPLLEMLFHDRWNDAISIFQILSIGAAFCFISGPATALIQARAQFRIFFIWTMICAIFFVAAVQVGARMGGAVSLAASVSVFYLIFGPLGTYVAIAPGGGRAKDVLAIHLVPSVAAALALGLPWLLFNTLFAHAGGSNWIFLLGTPLIGIPVYLALIRVWMRADWNELVARIAELLSRPGARRSAGINTP